MMLRAVDDKLTAFISGQKLIINRASKYIILALRYFASVEESSFTDL